MDGFWNIPDSSRLDDNSNDEDAGSDDDTDLSRVLFCEKSREQGSDPGTQFQDGGQPALAGLICGISRVIVSHVCRS